MNFSKFSCSHFSPIDNPQTMSKKLIQEGYPGEEERVVAKSKRMRNPAMKTIDWSQTALSSSTSYNPGIHTAKSSCLDLTVTGMLAARDSNENAASSSLVRQSDVNPNLSAGLFPRRQRIPLVQDCLTTIRQHPQTTSAILRKSTQMFVTSLVVKETTICLRAFEKQRVVYPEHLTGRTFSVLASPCQLVSLRSVASSPFSPHT